MKTRGLNFRQCLAFALALASTAWADAADVAALPQFRVPGFEAEMRVLNDLHALHHDRAFTDCTLWDAWLPMATLWASEKKRARAAGGVVGRHPMADGNVPLRRLPVFAGCETHGHIP